MTLEEKIQKDLMDATKNKDNCRMETLRLVKTEISKVKTAPNSKGVLTDDDVLKIMQKMQKERQETSEIYKANGRNDLAEKELSELNIISEYLPQKLSEDEVEKIVKEIIVNLNASTIKDMGKVMKEASTIIGCRSDGKTISSIVKKCLS